MFQKIKVLFAEYVIYNFVLAPSFRIDFLKQPECFHVAFSLEREKLIYGGKLLEIIIRFTFNRTGPRVSIRYRYGGNNFLVLLDICTIPDYKINYNNLYPYEVKLKSYRTGRLHSRSCIYSISKETVTWDFNPYNSSYHRP